MTVETAATAALTRAAEALHDTARAHKRLERHHRKQARELMRQLDRLRAVCTELGIEFELHDPTQPEEA